MSNNIKLKRSAVPGKIPLASQLNLGELAINTYDGKIYFKKDVSGTETVVSLYEVTENTLPINTTGYVNSGSEFLSGVLRDLDSAIQTAVSGGLTAVSSDSTLSGNGTQGSPLSVVNNGHSHTISNVTGLQTELDSKLNTSQASSFATSAQGAKADTALQPGANISLLTNNSGYITSAALNGYATELFVTTRGYLTTESDPVFTSSPAYGITTTLISNWNTAYGWGDHELAGYALSSDVTLALNNKQDTLISGLSIKTINGQSLLGYGNIVIEASSGGSTTLAGLSDVDLSGLSNGQVLKYNSATGLWTPSNDNFGVSLNSTDDLSEGLTNLYYTDARVASYLTNNNYATESFVTGQGYITSSALNNYATLTDLALKQNILVSGINIKTINGLSLIGAGNIVIESSSASPLTVSEINDLGIFSNQVNNVSAIRFDSSTGFNVTDLGSGEVKVSLGSSFKTIEVPGQESLVAVGEDTLRLIAGEGILLQTNPESDPQTLTISAIGGGSSSTELAALSDVEIVAPQVGQVLKYDGTKWVNGVDLTSGSNQSNSAEQLVVISNTSPTVIDTLFGGQYRSGEYNIQLSCPVGFHTLKLVFLDDGADVHLTQYSEVAVGALTSLGTFTATKSLGNTNIVFTPAVANTEVRFTKRLITSNAYIGGSSNPQEYVITNTTSQPFVIDAPTFQYRSGEYQIQVSAYDGENWYFNTQKLVYLQDSTNVYVSEYADLNSSSPDLIGTVSGELSIENENVSLIFTPNSLTFETIEIRFLVSRITNSYFTPPISQELPEDLEIGDGTIDLMEGDTIIDLGADDNFEESVIPEDLNIGNDIVLDLNLGDNILDLQ